MPSEHHLLPWQQFLIAEKGTEATTEMAGKHGRITFYTEKSLGYADPGATAGMLVFKGFLLYSEEKLAHFPPPQNSKKDVSHKIQKHGGHMAAISLSYL